MSYVDVLMGKADPALLRDSLVLVGATSLGLADSVPVPTSGFSRPMAGVEVHANVLNALRKWRWRHNGLHVGDCTDLCCGIAAADGRAGA